jgi:hypothetical protein
MLRIFIGYDRREAVAYHVLAHSILRRASVPVSITPVARQNMPFYKRERGELESTDFSITRFLVPYLCDFQGFALFLDSDMLCLGDVAEFTGYMTLMDHYGTAVRVVKHQYTPQEARKFLDQPQTRYERKNWSSVMLFNNRLCDRLTVDYVQSAHGLDLHQFKWTRDDRIQGLPKEWNWLVGEPGYENGAPKLLHYTKGTPCFPEYSGCPWADEWRAELHSMTSSG